MDRGEIRYAFINRALTATFHFGASELKTLCSLLIEQNGEVGEYSIFPGYSDLDQTEFSPGKSIQSLSLNSQRAVQYCLDQLRFLAEHKTQTFTPIRVNCLISAEACSLRDEIEASVKHGFNRIKIKFTPKNQIKVIAAIRDCLGSIPRDVEFRLDSNATFHTHEIPTVSGELFELPIEYWEDPIPLDDPYNYQYISKESPIAIALDQPVDSLERATTFLREKYCSYVVIKPQTLPSLAKFVAAINEGILPRKAVVLSSLFESELGISFLAQLASKLNLRENAHGLDTLKYFGNTTAKPLLFKQPDSQTCVAKYKSELTWHSLQL